MAKKNRFPPEPETQPDLSRKRPTARTSGAAPKSKRARSEAPTIPPPAPPPPSKRGDKAGEPRPSGIKARKSRTTDSPGAKVDEVTADLSRDPRRERE
jgi:hypothetical protein